MQNLLVAVVMNSPSSLKSKSFTTKVTKEARRCHEWTCMCRLKRNAIGQRSNRLDSSACGCLLHGPKPQNFLV